MKNLINQKPLNLDGKIYLIILSLLIIDIGGGFGFKDISFAFLAVYILLSSIKTGYLVQKKWLYQEGVLFVFIPIILMLTSILFRSVSISNALSAITPFAVWIIYPLLIRLDSKTIIDVFMKVLFYATIVVISTFIIIFVLNVVGLSSIVWDINSFTTKYSLGYIGFKKITDSVLFPDVFFKFVFLIIPAVVLWLDTDKNKKRWIICLIAAIITTSTGVILFTLLGIIWSILEKRTNIKKRKFVVIILVLAIFISIGSYFIDINQIFDFISSKLNFNSSESSNTKIMHIQSIIQIMIDNPLDLIFGTGLGSEFYSLGAGAKVINVEVSHFNFARQFGLFYAIVFFGYIFRLYIKLKKTDNMGNRLGIGMICVFFAAGTNPLLISPVFFILMIISRAYIEKYIKSEE